MREYTLKAFAFLMAIGLAEVSIWAQTEARGTGWDGLQPGSALVINDNFQGFEFFHSDDNPDMGNSNNQLDEETLTPIPGYKDTLVAEVALQGSNLKAYYYFGECAFAPEWYTAWGYKDALAASDLENIEDYQTAKVSKGFVEVSRDYGSTPPTIRGTFTVDLRVLDYVEAIQYSHSSCGGTKRGLLVEYSMDDGASWDTLRYQPGNTWSQSFTKDLFSGEKTYNEYNCQYSAYGLLWEDAIYESNMMIRFSEASGQVPRIHDLKVYGDLPTSVNKVQQNSIKVWMQNGLARFSAYVDVTVYNLSGVQVKHVLNTNEVSMDDMPSGLYIFKINNNGKSEVTKLRY